MPDPTLARLAGCNGQDQTPLRFGWADFGCNAHTGAIAAEPIGRPLCRGRKGEFVICDVWGAANEGLEAGMPPEFFPCRRDHGWYSQITYPAGYGIGKNQTTVSRTCNFYFYVCHCYARLVPGKSQRLAHVGIEFEPMARASSS